MIYSINCQFLTIISTFYYDSDVYNFSNVLILFTFIRFFLRVIYVFIPKEPKSDKIKRDYNLAISH